MAKELIVNVTSKEKRVAYLENNVVCEVYYERAKEVAYVGNIYKGKVQRVLPGMQAAFVEIGMEKAAFLYVSDVNEELGDVDASDEEKETKPRKRWRDRQQIQDLLRPGQDVLVQVARGPISTKGARVTSHISLPGRSVVYMPTWDKIGTSRRIGNDEERRRLRDIIRSYRPEEGGFIVRTASEGLSEEMIKSDIEYLSTTWREIIEKTQRTPAPALIHTELDIVLRLLRDLFSFEIERIVIDDREEFESILAFVKRFLPHIEHKVEFYRGKDPIFDHYGIETAINRALGAKGWLKSGGYLIIDQTEALTTIDVNTGRFVGRSNLEDTILKTNLEAVQEIVYQLRIRNLGGIIILDFIDMERRSSRERVYSALREALRRDRSKTTLSRITELGLIEMTRKRTHESLARVLCESCAVCEGRGYIKSRTTVCYEIFRQIQREAQGIDESKILVQVHPSVYEVLNDEEREGLIELEKKIYKKIVVEPVASFNPEHYEVKAIRG
ncbi:Rne/Rng family ribonuclease [Deltaproteobacteria bacterium PRO3]|nr:Rne/Rng family ribonuclease [Deltaproteobacteria bacterium PRO3]